MDTQALIARARELHDTKMCQAAESDWGNCDERNAPAERWCEVCTAEALAAALSRDEAAPASLVALVQRTQSADAAWKADGRLFGPKYALRNTLIDEVLAWTPAAPSAAPEVETLRAELAALKVENANIRANNEGLAQSAKESGDRAARLLTAYEAQQDEAVRCGELAQKAEVELAAARAALAELLEMFDAHETWCGYNKRAPGNNIINTATAKARAVLAGSAPTGEGDGR